MKLLFCFIISLCFVFSQSHQAPFKGNRQKQINRKEAELKIQQFIKRSNKTLKRAYRLSEQNSAHKKMLAKAYRHQRLAIKLLKNERLKLALRHSVYAKKLAIKLIEAEKLSLEEDDKIPDTALVEEFSDEEAEKSLISEDPEISTLKDEEVLAVNLEDLKQ